MLSTGLVDTETIDATARYRGLPDCAALPAGILTAWAWKRREGFCGRFPMGSGVTELFQSGH